ncbi:uncharacterized protein [Miscanthus floridulus]|uniref:uncharacterized protein n=1 Tax=Miscanthus floridulus TaxID=154761 RepID=UPI00345AF0A4
MEGARGGLWRRPRLPPPSPRHRRALPTAANNLLPSRCIFYLNDFWSNKQYGLGLSYARRTWILGIFLTTLSTTSWALWTVLQASQDHYFIGLKILNNLVMEMNQEQDRV